MRASVRSPTAIEDRIAAEPAAAWLERLDDAAVPCGPVLSQEAVRSDPQILANRLVETVEQPGLGSVDVLGRLFGLTVAGGERARTAPLLGADTEAVLAELE